MDHDLDQIDHDLDQILIDHDRDQIDHDRDQIDHDLDHLDPNPPLSYVVNGMYSTYLTLETCPRSCRSGSDLP